MGCLLVKKQKSTGHLMWIEPVRAQADGLWTAEHGLDAILGISEFQLGKAIIQEATGF